MLQAEGGNGLKKPSSGSEKLYPVRHSSARSGFRSLPAHLAYLVCRPTALLHGRVECQKIACINYRTAPSGGLDYFRPCVFRDSLALGPPENRVGFLTDISGKSGRAGPNGEYV